MTSKVQKKAFNNNYNHHRIFNDGEDLEEAELEQLQNKLNVMEINPQQRKEEKKVNPTYKSQIFSSDQDEIPQFRNLQGQQYQKDQTAEQLFGVHGAMQTRQKRSNQSATEENNAVIVQNNQGQSSASKKTKDKQLPFNAMWWDNKSIPNNDLNQLQNDFAKQRKNQDFSSNNIFQVDQARPYSSQVSTQSKKELQQQQSSKYNIINNQCDDKKDQYESQKQQLAQQKQALQQEICNDIEARKANRNYSNLFGRCQTAQGDQRSNCENSMDISKNISAINCPNNNKSELFLPTNAHIDHFDSRIYNPKGEKENNDMNACQRHFKNLKSVLDTHDYNAEFKRGLVINKDKPIQYDAGNILDNFSEIRSEVLNENNSKPPKKCFVRVGEMEKVQQIEFKNMKTHFDQENFKRFCIQKGYKVLVFTSNSNGRGSIFLRENRKNPDPIDSISSNLKIHGANVAQLKEISGKEFNARNFEAPFIVKKSGQPPRPATGKKQFNNQQANHQSHNIFKEDKK